MNSTKATEMLRSLLRKECKSEVAIWEELNPYLIKIAKRACTRMGLSEDPEELSQQALLYMYDHQIVEGEVLHYYTKIVYTYAKDALMATKGVFYDYDEDVLAGIADKSKTPEELCMDSVDSHTIKDALDQIDPDQSTALQLKYFFGLTGEDISEAMKTPVENVYGLLKRGKKSLRAELEPEM